MRTPTELQQWRTRPALWLEAFIVTNFAFLALDIFLAHSANQFREPAEYLPLLFSILAPPVLAAALLRGGRLRKWTGYVTGWIAIGIGLAGVLFHLDNQFFYEKTLLTLTYAAPFAAPLAYTGLGLLLLVNRMIEEHTRAWAEWVQLLACGGFFGNFVLSLTDHATNGFFRPIEWLPVASSALAVGFLIAPFLRPPASREYYSWCYAVLGLQAAVGLLGFSLHVSASLRGPGALWDRVVNGAPLFAPLLFPNLVLLSLIGLSAYSEVSKSPSGSGSTSPSPAIQA